MNINIKVEGVDKALKELDPKKVQRAAVTACNRTATHARAQITKLSRTEYTAKARSVREAISIKRANQSNLQSVVTVGRQVVPLIDYRTKGGATEKKATAATASVKRRKRTIPPVQAMVKKAGGYKMLPKAFKATLKYGRNIFARLGRSKSGISALSGPSLGGIVQSNFEKLKTTLQSYLNREFQSALKYGRGRGGNE